MKTLKTVILTFSFILFATILVKANPAPKAKRTVDYVLNQYIDCMSKGKTTDFSRILDENFKHQISHNGRTSTYSKNQVVKYMNSTKNLSLNCSTSFSLVESNKNFLIAKVEMEFPTFTKTDYVTMSVNSDTEWTITNVFTTYN